MSAISPPCASKIFRVVMWTPRSGGSMPIDCSVAISSGCATMPAPRPASSPSTRSYTSTVQPARRRSSAASSPLMEPPITRARRDVASFKACRPGSQREKTRYKEACCPGGNDMALSMMDKAAERSDKGAWPAEIKAEFEREARNPNPCVGTILVSESDRVRVWMIRLAPGERIGFHRHVLDYFWTAVSGGRGRQHVHDGTTVEYTYQPGETRHETYGPGQFKVHDLENLGDKEMVFMTIEFLNSANKPMPVPDHVRVAAAA